jgi:hypothetical protein
MSNIGTLSSYNSNNTSPQNTDPTSMIYFGNSLVNMNAWNGSISNPTWNYIQTLPIDSYSTLPIGILTNTYNNMYGVALKGYNDAFWLVGYNNWADSFNLYYKGNYGNFNISVTFDFYIVTKSTLITIHIPISPYINIGFSTNIAANNPDFLFDLLSGGFHHIIFYGIDINTLYNVTFQSNSTGYSVYLFNYTTNKYRKDNKVSNNLKFTNNLQIRIGRYNATTPSEAQYYSRIDAIIYNISIEAFSISDNTSLLQNSIINQVSSLTTSQISNMSIEKLKYFTPNQLINLSPAAVASLTKMQLLNLSTLSDLTHLFLVSTTINDNINDE